MFISKSRWQKCKKNNMSPFRSHGMRGQKWPFLLWRTIGKTTFSLRLLHLLKVDQYDFNKTCHNESCDHNYGTYRCKKKLRSPSTLDARRPRKQQKHDFLHYFGLKSLQDQVFHNSLLVFIHYLLHFSWPFQFTYCVFFCFF